MKKWLWRAFGIFFVGLAYIGVVTPGIPSTIFIILASWAFSKSSPAYHKWLHEHPWFGKYLTNWEQKKIYPQKGRWAMVGMMLISLITLYFTVSFNIFMLIVATFMLICVWAFKFPGTEAEYNERIQAGKKIGWIK